MKVLLVYGTNSGGTQAASEIIGDSLRTAGHRVVIQRANAQAIEPFQMFDLVVLGSCTWERFEGKRRLEGQLQQHMYALVQRLSGQPLPGHRFAVYGLGDTGYTNFCQAADHLERFVREVGGRLVAPTLRIDGFYFNLPANRERVRQWARSLPSSARKTSSPRDKTRKRKTAGRQ